MPPPSRLLRTTAFKLALIYLALFSLSAVILLGLVWWLTAGFMERQTAEVIQAEVQGLADQYRTAGLPGLRRVVERRGAADPVHGGVYLLTDTLRQRVAGNVDGWPQVRETGDGWLRFTFDARPEVGVPPERRQALGKAFGVGPGFHLLVGRDIEDRLRLQATILRAIGWGLGLTLLLGLAGGFLMSRQLLRRVDAINRATAGIMAGDLSRRIELTGSRDEFDQLAANLNAMLERIERLLEGLRQVTDNIAHDLRTPLNRIRSRIEVALLSEPDAEGARELLRATVRDAEALIHTFNALLDIAKAEAGGPEPGAAPLDLAGVTRDVAELYQPLAEDKGLAFAVEADDGPLPACADRHLLAQAMANLLDNAVKYTPPGGRVVVAARDGPDGPTFVVADTGPGIPEDQRERVLERFVRLDTGRSTPGNGLGLSLVRAVARRHGATLRLDDNAPGLRVTMTFPPPAADAPLPAPAADDGVEQRRPEGLRAAS